MKHLRGFPFCKKFNPSTVRFVYGFHQEILDHSFSIPLKSIGGSFANVQLGMKIIAEL